MTGIAAPHDDDTITALYRAGVRPRVVDVPELTFLMLDGAGDPNGSADYEAAVQALFTLAWTLRFAIRDTHGVVRRVAPLEGLWWADDMAGFGDADRDSWQWTMMIRQSPEATPDLVAGAVEQITSRKGLPAVAGVRLETFTEGRAAQVLHVGPYSSEAPTIARLHAFVHDLGGTFDGRRQRHHEIYLGDPRRSAPERLRTIVRQPFTDPNATGPDRRTQ
jgi:hypothetical protein